MTVRYRRLICLWLASIDSKRIIVCRIVAHGPLLVGVLVVLVLWGWLLAIIVLGMSILRHYGVSIGVPLWVWPLICDSESGGSRCMRERVCGSWEADGLDHIDSRALRACGMV